MGIVNSRLYLGDDVAEFRRIHRVKKPASLPPLRPRSNSELNVKSFFKNVRYGRIEPIKIFAESGGDLNCKDMQKVTVHTKSMLWNTNALSLAVHTSNILLLNVLLHLGADPSQLEPSPFDDEYVAGYFGSIAMELSTWRLLVDYGLNLSEARDKMGRTFLEWMFHSLFIPRLITSRTPDQSLVLLCCEEGVVPDGTLSAAVKKIFLEPTDDIEQYWKIPLSVAIEMYDNERRGALAVVRTCAAELSNDELEVIASFAWKQGMLKDFGIVI